MRSQKPRGYWTKEKLTKIALRYDDHAEFVKEQSPAYQAARKIGILKEITSHMSKKKAWTSESLKAEASKYKSRQEFRKNAMGAYLSAHRRKIIDEVCSHMPPLLNSWTLESLKKAATPYSTISEFRRGNPAAHAAATANHWKDYKKEICGHMTQNFVDWTPDLVRKVALKCETREEFREKYSGARKAAIRWGIYEEVVSHMKMLGNIYSRLIYAFEFPRSKTAYIGLTFNIEEREKCHLRYKKGPIYRYVNRAKEEYKLKELTEYLPVKEAQKKEQFYIDKYKSEGWTLLNTGAAGLLGGNYKCLTVEKCLEIASKCKDRKEIRDNHPGVYLILRKKKKMDEACGHMPNKGFRRELDYLKSLDVK